jgi:surface antigen
MKLTKFALPVALVLALAACAPGQVKKQTGGTLIGAGLGALTGSQIGGGKGKLAAVAIGALAGAYLGSEVGKSLDRADRLAMEQTSQTALESNRSGQASSWNNPDSGHSGTVTPTRTYQTASGGPCREYQQTVTIDGKTEQAYGRACRQSDGSWKITN